MKNSCASRELSVGELARRAGVAVSALHFYETKGLISSQRNAGNQRRFSRETLRRVVVIKVAQRVGIPLAEIARALQTLPAGRSPSAADWARLSAQWKEDLQGSGDNTPTGPGDGRGAARHCATGPGGG